MKRLVGLLFTLSACQSQQLVIVPDAADLLLLNAHAYTMDAENPWVEAIAIKDDKILAVGNTEQMQQYRQSNTIVIDLGGRTVIPGINDAHVHPVWGGIKEEFECSFAFSASPEQIAATVAECVASAPEAPWVIGGQWDSDLFRRFDIPSPKALLDKVAPNTAVILESDSGHDVWVNSKALALAGVNADSVSPAGGRVVREQNSREPNGVLLENARELLGDTVPDWNEAQYQRGLQVAMQIANSYGITAFKSAAASQEVLQAMHSAASNDSATLQLAAAIDMREQLKQNFDIQAIIETRDKYQVQGVDLRYVKFFLDGVPTSSRTAAMLENYLPENGHKAHNGEMHYSLQALQAMLLQLDAAGFTVKIHAAGDRSVRMALDAIEFVRAENGDSGLRHELAHAGYIDETDLPRFAQLGVVADLSPYLWHPSGIIDSVIGAVGERGQEYWPIQSLIKNAASLAAGSDWPAAVPSINPWPGIEAMVSRANPYESGPITQRLWPQQQIDLGEALQIYIQGGAAAMRMGEMCLCAGARASLAVLDQAIFDVAIDKLDQTQAYMTVFDGKIVYRQP